jgi:hypothetical protein
VAKSSDSRIWKSANDAGGGGSASPGREYKILFDITKAAEAPDEINPGLEHVARLINLFALAKIPPQKLKIVAVLHGRATAASLDDRYHREKYQRDNPNSKLIDALKQPTSSSMSAGRR